MTKTISLKETEQSDPAFAQSLKYNNPKRFVGLATGLKVILPEFPGQFIICCYFLDLHHLRDNKKPLFKQDYIVFDGNKYVSYTKTKNPRKNVKPLQQFFNVYGLNKHFGTSAGNGDHYHNDVSDLPLELRQEASVLKNELLKN